MKTYASMPGIRTRRKMLGMNIKDASATLGVCRQSWSSWEQGSTMPTAGILPALAELLECRIEDLYVGEEGDDGQAADEG
ncbi:MAG: helix-turn-helix transcriptional regulator [Eubacteriales bacterium]|nr:helix-turn-helix transcriptional regulator [Eubacteriales bacterium]